MNKIDQDEMQARLTAVRTKLSEWQVDGILVSSPENRRWLSGFSGSAGYLLVTAVHALLATDFRYYEQAEQQAPAFTLFKHQRTQADTEKMLETVGVSTMGFEAESMSVAEADRLAQVEGVKWTPLSETFEPLRAIKSASELAKIRAAAAITDQVMAQFPAIARPGITELAAAWELEKAMREAGAEAAAFDVIVASGPNAALPHHHPGERWLQSGDAIIVDMGAQVDGYKSDMTRTFFLGEPTEQFWQVYNVALAAQTAVLTHAASGMPGQTVDALARDYIREAGYGDHFGHGLGHSLGLAIHEAPFLTYLPRGEKYTLEAGMVMTIEPGVYLPGWGGVRIEDLVLVTETGLKAISQCPKNPIIPIS